MPPPQAPDKSSITTSDNVDDSTCTIHWRRSTIRSDCRHRSDRIAAAGNSGSDHSTTTAGFDRNIVASHRRNIADCFGRSTVGCFVVGQRLCWLHRLS